MVSWCKLHRPAAMHSCAKAQAATSSASGSSNVRASPAAAGTATPAARHSLTLSHSGSQHHYEPTHSMRCVMHAQQAGQWALARTRLLESARGSVSAAGVLRLRQYAPMAAVCFGGGSATARRQPLEFGRTESVGTGGWGQGRHERAPPCTWGERWGQGRHQSPCTCCTLHAHTWAVQLCTRLS